MYRFYRIPFNSPFAGLFLPPEDYLRLLENFGVIREPILMTDRDHSRYAARYAAERNYPVGILPGGIEVHFLHYATAAGALEKWSRRVPRIDPANMIVKFHQGTDCTDEHIRRFAALPFANKVCFVARPVEGAANCTLRLPEFAGRQCLDGKYWKTADLHYNLARRANAIK